MGPIFLNFGVPMMSLKWVKLGTSKLIDTEEYCCMHK